MKKIVRGNDFTLRIPVMKQVGGEKVPYPLPACTDVQVRVCNQFKRISLQYEVDVENDNVIFARVEGDQIPLGTYAIEVRGKILGNDWRSEEYPQFEIVARNADADTEFGETDDGDNSVEMDTALVILPPSVELTDLIKQSQESLTAMKTLNESVSGEEEKRVDAEKGRVSAENLRVLNEDDRIKAENARNDAETKRETALSSAVDDANTKFASFVETSTTKVDDAVADGSKKVTDFVSENQEKLDSAVKKAGTDTQTAIDELTTKVNDSIEKSDAAVKKAIDDFTSHSTAFDTAEGERAKAEVARENAEKKRESDFAAAKSACETVTDKANAAASDALDAASRANTAADGVEKCDVTLEGSVISVTDREGETKTIDVIGPGEKVVVYVSSSVEGLSVSGLKINVYLNNGKTPQTYTTNGEGVAKFEVDKGNYYEVVFPEFGNAQAITPVGFTSVLGARDIRVEYKPYSMDETEETTISVMKYDEGNGTAFVGAKVSVTIGADTQEYTTDDNGKVYVYVPYGKDYTVSVKDQEAYFVRYAKNDRTYTAKLPKRSIVYTMYQYKTGILVVDDSLNEYLIDDWLADGKSPDDAVAIRVAEQQLLLNGGSFLFRVSDLKNLSKLVSRQWCTQNIQFNSIALNGNNVKDENYYRGETSTFLIRQEAEERSLSILAFDYAWNQELVIGNQHLRGFLMSVGQEYIHIANRVEIGEVLRKLFGDEIADAYLTFVTSKNRWTSAQNYATYAWYYNSQAGSYSKGSSFYVLPVFAC